jgi:hypothetical protein
MDEDKIRALIVKRLSRSQSSDDIIMDLCLRHEMTWAQAEALVNDVQLYHESEITRRQSPLLLIITLGIFIGGAYLMVSSVMHGYRVISYALAEQNEVLRSASVLLYLLQYAPGTLGAFVLSLGMMAGSLAGMKSIIAAFADKFAA